MVGWIRQRLGSYILFPSVGYHWRLVARSLQSDSIHVGDRGEQRIVKRRNGRNLQLKERDDDFHGATSRLTLSRGQWVQCM